jgi:hypothetical protein
MSEATPYRRKIDRRTALIWTGVVGAATAVGAGVVVYGPRTGGEPEARGYGTDPRLVEPEKAPWPRIMSEAQLQTAAVLADFILPATPAAPAASALGIPDFIDEWVSAPYPDQAADRPVILRGLDQLAPAVREPADRKGALEALPHADDAATLAFFKRFRALTIGAYYTTEAGFKAIGYIGNVARPADPGPSEAVKAALEARLRQLGL